MSNPLQDVLPPTVRKYAYAALFLAALVFGVWQASNGDWLVFAGSLITALLGLLAASNTDQNTGGGTPPNPGPVLRDGNGW